MHLKSDELAALRRIYALSQQQLGKELGVSAMHISYLESGQRSITPELVDKAVEKFALDTAKIVEIKKIVDSYSMKGVD
ncbi:helix-turn-helix transcriptional regulator [Alkalihalobacillus sp. LMS6]|uniref:helix-turn-helix domain-containing protein n=1 Tax=Alkalihalobacillus sp. LMS6 TaxID=2924034 RepID=UPI0020D1A439|nr:helix-turn-helix transcriptional regulator [Alkalihalobacillus sp. LMS6]UTR07713.1 helix-turn-helix transcriptional regulator [Alkalihalobacillus sp. LMS6]